MRQAGAVIHTVLKPVVEGLGYTYVGAEFGMSENGQTLRVYIDKPGGIVLDDCGLVSRQLSALLDVEDPIDTAYQLEVSSPGVDRPLFTIEHFDSAVGGTVKLKATRGVEGRRNFKGLLRSVAEGQIEVEVDGQRYVLALDDIEQARLLGDL